MHPPLMIDGIAYDAHKGFHFGTQRTVSPAVTLERIRAVAPRVGLTRLADVTGLDRIGIPTVAGYRPNAPTMSVSGGKGFTTLAAMASAGMETVEIWHAENLRLEVVLASHAELDRAGLTLPAQWLPLTKHALFDPHRAEPWVWGWDLVGQRRMAVPYACVSMGNSMYRPVGRWMPFVAGSNGLAGGNHLLEAVAAALYEVCERDAVACTRAVGRGLGERVDLETLSDPLVRSLIDQFEAAGVSAYLFDATVDTGVPAYAAVVADRVDPAMGLFKGYGAHLDPGIAMIRALTEAAQGRVLLIAGSRDDYFGREQRANRLFGDQSRLDFEAIPATADGNRHAGAVTESFAADIQIVIQRLCAAGLESVIVVDLTHPELGIPVARVIVPGLEGYHFDFYRPGPRAQAHAHRAAMAAHR